MCARCDSLADALRAVIVIAGRRLQLYRDEQRDIDHARALLDADPLDGIRDECARLGIAVVDDAVSLRDAATLAGICYRHACRVFGGAGRGKKIRVELRHVATFIRSRM